MPEISRFYGIRITMHFGDHEHPPPHFHAAYGSHKALLGLDGAVLKGSLPGAALRMVREWATANHAALAANWERAVANQPLSKIQPL